MPYDENGQGYSEHTGHKLEDLERIYGMWLNIASRALHTPGGRYWNRELVYIDATCGSGHSQIIVDDKETTVEGSPLIFRRLATKKNIPFTCHFIDQNKFSTFELRCIIGQDGRVKIHTENYQDTLERLQINRPAKQIGLLFIDPNTPSEFDFDSIASFCRRHPKIDVLIHLSATAQKRANQERLSDILKILGKKHWLIRKPYIERANFQWTYLLGSNSNLFKNYKKINFFILDSPEARAFFDTLNLTKDELKKKHQMKLPGFDLTAITPSI